MDAILSATHDISSLRLFTNTGACSVVSPVPAEPTSDAQPYLPLKSLGLSFTADIRNRAAEKDDSSMLVRTRGEIDEASRRMYPSGNRTTKGMGEEGLLHLLQSCPALEKLDLHFCHVPVPGLKQYDQMFAIMVHGTSLTELKSLAIRGLYVKESSLLRFLQQSPSIQKLKIDYVHLTEGDWQPIIRYFGQMSQLEEVTLASLYSNSRLVDLRLEKEGTELEGNTGEHIPMYRGTLLHARTLCKDDLSPSLALKSQQDLGSLLARGLLFIELGAYIESITFFQVIKETMHSLHIHIGIVCIGIDADWGGWTSGLELRRIREHV